MKEWVTLRTCECDLEAGYAQINETVDNGQNDTLKLKELLDTIDAEQGVPPHRIDLTEHWIDDKGIENFNHCGTAIEYLI